MFIEHISVKNTDGVPVEYWLPANESDVIQLCNEAQQNNEVICLRGSAHSFPLIKTLETSTNAGRPYKFIMLSKMRDVFIDTASKTVRVEAGCNLGKDPYDPSGISTERNSLLFQLDQQGLALTDLGGIIHQSVGGFMATGSSGGSTQFSFDESILSVEVIQFVNGKAQKVTYNKPNNGNLDDPFYAIGVHLGVLGVVTAVTVQCVDKFYIEGNEKISKETECEANLFGEPGDGSNNNRKSYEQFLKDTPYTRMLWWPQEKVEKVVLWQAKPIPSEPNGGVKPYHEVPYIMGSPVPATAGADLLFTGISTWPLWFDNYFGEDKLFSKAIKTLINGAFYPLIFPKVIDAFVSEGPRQEFSDVAWKGLPMDNQMNDKLFPVWFTELWIPIDKTMAVMKALRAFYDKGPDNTMAFCTEIYAAKGSDFWMSPSYQTDVVRIDVFWFGNHRGSPVEYYQKFWDLLEPFNFRPHWGKYLPASDSKQGITYLKSRYSKWDDWMSFRKSVDPNDVFLNDYWKDHLGQ